MKKILLSLVATSLVAAGVFAATNTTTSTDDSSQPPATQPQAQSQPKPHARLRALGGIAARRLELTDAQRDALKEVVRLHRPELQPLTAQARSERAELRAIVAAPTLDETALAAQADKIAATQKQLLLARTHLRADLRKILTPEQQAKLDAWRERAGRRISARRTMFLNRLG